MGWPGEEQWSTASVNGGAEGSCSSCLLALGADGKTYKKPRRPFEKERLDAELKTVGEYGLRNKRELWRVQVWELTPCSAHGEGLALGRSRLAVRTLQGYRTRLLHAVPSHACT